MFEQYFGRLSVNIYIFKSYYFSNITSIDEDDVKEILRQLDIGSPSTPPEEKIKVLCAVFRAAVAENAK